MFCSKCGSQLPEGSTSCNNCGAEILSNTKENRFKNVNNLLNISKKSKLTILGVFAILLIALITYLVVNSLRVTINKTTDKIPVGSNDTLIATVNPSNATNKTVKWTSSDNNIAKVDDNATVSKVMAGAGMGAVTGVSAGTATITATTDDGDKIANCVVTVNSPDYNTGITYDQLSRTPDNFKDKGVTFSGKVLQTIDGDNEVDLRVAVDDNYSNVLYVKYNPSIASTRVLENDHVTIKGLSKGLYTYKSTLGGNITIPSVSVNIITIN